MADQPRILSATTLIGDDVKNPAGEDLGKLEEIMIDLKQGKVAFAVLSFGGFMGLGNKLFAIPWQAFGFDAEHHNLILNVDKELLKNAPGFDKDDWPDFNEVGATWLVEIHDYYGFVV